MSIIRARIATTHVDMQKELLTREALEQLAEQTKANYIRVTAEHDPRKVPIGRVIDSQVVPLEDGELAVENVIEIYDGKEPAPDQEGKELALSLCKDEENIVVHYDFSYRTKEIIQMLESLNGKLQHHTELQYFAKKAVEPLSILVVGGAFVLGKIFEGFLHKVGEETFHILKKELMQVLQVQSEKKERVLEFDLTIRNGDQLHAVRLYLTNPTEEDIELVLEKGLKKLDATLGGYLRAPIRELGINLIDRKFEITYGLNGKAKPLIPTEKIRLIDIEA